MSPLAYKQHRNVLFSSFVQSPPQLSAKLLLKIPSIMALLNVQLNVFAPTRKFNVSKKKKSSYYRLGQTRVR